MKEKADDPLSNIVYISVPPDFTGKIGMLDINPGILLPVETGEQVETWNPGELSWEAIISGMLKILAYNPTHQDAGYYRQFITSVRPNLAQELTEAAILKARNHDYDLAEEIFRALIGYQPANSRYLINLALMFEERATVYKNLGNTEKQEYSEEQAFSWYRRALSLDDVVPEAYLYAGYFHLRQNNFSLATSCLSAYLDQGDDEAQKANIRDVLSRIEGQDLADNMFKEAYDYIRMGKEETGVERIREFLKDHEDVWNAWFILGWGLRRLTRYEEALDAFRNAIERGGDTPDSWNELAICQMELGDFEQSRNSLERALKSEPENVKIISNLGILSLKIGNSADAEGFFKTVLEFEPDDAIARKYLEHIRSTQD